MPTNGRDVNGISSHSLWAATAAPGPELGSLSGDQRAQVTIIGGGYTGLSTALHLADAGRDAVVLEAGMWVSGPPASTGARSFRV